MLLLVLCPKVIQYRPEPDLNPHETPVEFLLVLSGVEGVVSHCAGPRKPVIGPSREPCLQDTACRQERNPGGWGKCQGVGSEV